jgi:predicted nucleic acid-binding protein
VAVAEERGVSVASVVREAIDRGLPAPDTRRRAAAKRRMAAEPMPVPEPDALAAELDGLRSPARMIVLDTTVLVYAVGADHPLRDPCRDLVDAIATGRISATTTVEVLQEFTHVRSRRRDREDAAGLTRDDLDLLAPLLVVGEDELQDGLRLSARSDRLGAFDAVLTAAASRAGADAVISADVAFADADLTHVVPDAEGVAVLLEG